MYYIIDNIDLKELEKYGFKHGYELPDYDSWIGNVRRSKHYWLVSTNQYGIEYRRNSEFPIWSVEIRDNRKVCIECASDKLFTGGKCTEEMFYVLKRMIEDGIIIDDFNSHEKESIH